MSNNIIRLTDYKKVKSDAKMIAEQRQSARSFWQQVAADFERRMAFKVYKFERG